MKIEKKIHYCWFGGNPLPESVEYCIQSWKKYCPDYEIIQWNESNFDVQQNRYMREAYQQKKWAFVSDYARLKIIYDQGGIYLDTDVELVRSLDTLLEQEGFMGFQNKETVATGLGFGAVAGHCLIKALLDDYEEISFFNRDGSMDLTPCPNRNTACMVQLGLQADGTRQTLQGIEIYPAEYFSPLDWKTGKLKLTENSYSIHRYDASWLDKKEHRWMKVQQVIGEKNCYRIRYSIPERLKKLFGR
ncbi:MAG: glycosyltransferase [Lachnospiraceae bacterium]|nr:glycosyltransferase [Lachnospiraceae bacterium]